MRRVENGLYLALLAGAVMLAVVVGLWALASPAEAARAPADVTREAGIREGLWCDAQNAAAVRAENHAVALYCYATHPTYTGCGKAPGAGRYVCWLAILITNAHGDRGQCTGEIRVNRRKRNRRDASRPYSGPLRNVGCVL